MKCPHCLEGIHENWTKVAVLGGDADVAAGREFETMTCPECGRHIVQLKTFRYAGGGVRVAAHRRFVHPIATSRAIPPELEGEYATDFREACAVLPLSPKASAAISRRLLQHVIREQAGIKKRNLDEEINELLAANVLPADLAEDLDAIRQIGNFSAHPIKSTETGTVVEVEEGEAEWLLDLLEELLDVYFVRPKKRAAKRDALNKKLEDVGKPELKVKAEPEG